MNFSLYSPELEENIYIRTRARSWFRSGLITDEQLRAIKHNTKPDVKQARKFFRELFLLFTLLAAGAVTGLAIWLMRNGGILSIAVILILFSAGYYLLAEYLVMKRRLYRHGIEEGLALIALFFFYGGCLLLLHDIAGYNKNISIAGTSLFALAASWIYLRFGYLYAALLGIGALCFIPFQFSTTPLAGRMMLFPILLLIFFIHRILDKPYLAAYRKERNTIIQSFLLALIYLTINIQLTGLLPGLSGSINTPSPFPAAIHWSSYALTFILPAISLYWGIQTRQRLIINISLVMAFVTLATNKSYLGMTRYAWDPAILGIMLIALFIVITHWLNKGPNKRRYGVTAEAILQQGDGINISDVAAALTPGTLAAQQPPPQDNLLEGGASGGGGTQRDY